MVDTAGHHAEKKNGKPQLKGAHVFLFAKPIPSMYTIFTHIWLIFMVNVGKYTIHGCYGKDIEECQTEAELRKLVEKKPNFVMETQEIAWDLNNDKNPWLFRV